MVPSMSTQSPSLMPYFAAVSGWISIGGSGLISRSQGIMRCSEWNMTPTRRPVFSISGYSLCISGVLTSLSIGSTWCGSGFSPYSSNFWL